MDIKEVKKAWKIYNKECKKVKAPTVTFDEYISMLSNHQESYDQGQQQEVHDGNQQQEVHDGNQQQEIHDGNQQQEIHDGNQQQEVHEENQQQEVHDENQQQGIVANEQETQNLEINQNDTDVNDQITNTDSLDSPNSDGLTTEQTNFYENGNASKTQTYTPKEIKKAWKIYCKECKKTKSPFLSLEEYTKSLNQQQDENINQGVSKAQTYTPKEIKKAWKIYCKECKKAKSPFLSLEEYTKNLNEQPLTDATVNEQQNDQNIDINNESQIESNKENTENNQLNENISANENISVNENISANEDLDIIDIDEKDLANDDSSQIYSGNTAEEISKSFAASEINKINSLSKDSNYSENNSELFSVIKTTKTFSEFNDSSVNSTKKIEKNSLFNANEQKKQLGDLKRRLSDSKRSNSRKSFDIKNAKNSLLISQKYKSFNSTEINKNKTISERLEARKKEFLKKNSFYNKDGNKFNPTRKISSSPILSSKKIRGFASNSEKIKTI